MSINSNENENCMRKIQRDGLSISLDYESIDICNYHSNLKVLTKSPFREMMMRTQGRIHIDVRKPKVQRLETDNETSFVIRSLFMLS